MSDSLLASIVISSYNYGRFLRRAIDSALSQTYPNTEVIVADDCSTDDSREIILSYGDRVIPMLREKNEGGDANYNEACRMSRGQVIFILDSDDMLCPTVVERAMPHFHDSDVVKVHWPLWEINVNGRKTGRVVPCPVLPEGRLREAVARNGPFNYPSPSTSGNAYARGFLEDTLPLPRGVYGDSYVCAWASASGTIRRLPEPQGFYRIHSRNTYAKTTFDQRLKHDMTHLNICCTELSEYYCEHGMKVDTEVWKKNSWHWRVHRSVEEIQEIIPPEDTFILADEDNWGTHGSVAGHRALPFPELDGYYGGHPPDDETALREFERLRQLGASFIVFAWPAFWWLDHYAGLRQHLRGAFPCVRENDRLIAFDLRTEGRVGGEKRGSND